MLVTEGALVKLSTSDARVIVSYMRPSLVDAGTVVIREGESTRNDIAASSAKPTFVFENVGELARLAPFGRENPTPVLLVQHAFVDGIWPMGAEGRHTRIRLRQGSDTLFASSFGIAPQAFAYPVGSEVEVAL